MNASGAISGVYIDVETGDFDAARSALLEVGAVEFVMEASGPRVVKTWEQVIVPGPRLMICKEALAVQGRTFADLTDEALEKAGAVSEEVAFNRLMMWLPYDLSKPENKRLWSHNAGFENPFLYHWEKRVFPKRDTKSFVFPVRGVVTCSKELARNLRAIGRLPVLSTSLKDLAPHFGIVGPQAHRGLLDAHLGVQVLWHLMRVAGWLPQSEQAEPIPYRTGSYGEDIRFAREGREPL